MGDRENQRVLIAEALSALRHIEQTTTEFMERIAGQVVNHVLEVYSGVLDANGQFTRDYQVAAGSVRVRNLGAVGHTMAVSSAPPSLGGNPTAGTGLWLVPGGQADTVPLASHVLTIYGTVGDQFSVVVFTPGPRPVTG